MIKIEEVINRCQACGYPLFGLVTIKTEEGNKEIICRVCLIDLQVVINHNIKSAINKHIKRLPLRVRPDGKDNYYLDIASDLEFSRCFIDL